MADVSSDNGNIKKTWTTPTLNIFSKGSNEEAVLGACKTSSGGPNSGPGFGFAGCIPWFGQATCNDVVSS